MKIHLIRHAEAVDRTSEITEEHRWLTRKGRTRFRDAAAALAKGGLSPDVIITSPLVRAVQTADILAEELEYEGELVLSTEVGPGFSIERLEKILARYRDAKEVAFVGHEPDFGTVTARLIGVTHCALTKGMTVSFQLSGGADTAEFVQLVTGKGKLLKSRDQAVERLTKSEE